MRDSLVEHSDDLHLDTEVYAGADTFISWAVTNPGPQSINETFFVDLALDGVVVKRWTVESGVSRNGYYVVDGWGDIATLKKPYSGFHTLQLIVDPTNLVLETDESDNTFEHTFEWLELPGGGPPPVPPDVFDLVPFAPDGWSDAIIANATIDETTNGDLHVNMQTHISYALRNLGATDVPESRIVPVYLYFDDAIVDIEYWQGVPATEEGVRAHWSGLHQAVHISEGPHRIRLEIDPLNQVLEINEVNNVLEAEFIWGPPVVAP